MNDVALVIPARNAERTLDACLRAVVPLLDRELREIVVVDDGSTDATAAIAARFPVRVVHGSGEGPSRARNLGWRTTAAELVWFVDADCVAEAGALPPLLELIERTGCAGAGGTYTNASPESWLATAIDDEIAVRHAAMVESVDYLATFDVMYRREVLEKVGGFDESLVRAEDVDLAWRILAAGGELRFTPRSRVAHFHEERVLPYLRTQAANGYWRTWLYASHPEHAGGDSYSSWVDHMPPVLALAALGAAALAPWWPTAGLAGLAAASTAALQWPMARDLSARRNPSHGAAFAVLATARALARGLGLALGAGAVAWHRLHHRTQTSEGRTG